MTFLPSPRHSLLAAAVAVLAASGAAAAQGPTCTTSAATLPTLTVTLDQAPSTVVAGRTTTVPVTVTRAGLPAAEAGVWLHLRHSGDARSVTTVYGGSTDQAGRSSLQVPVPSAARGALTVEVHALATVAELPCHQQVDEHGTTTGPWGRAAR